MRVIITGAKHSGKTTTGKYIAETLSIPFYDTDDRIVSDYEKKTGVKTSVREIIVSCGNKMFRELEQEAVRNVLLPDFCVVSTGGGAVLESDTRKLLFNDSVVVHLCADEDLLWSRIEKNGIPPFYQGEDGRTKHRARVALIDEVMRPRADIVLDITSANENSVSEELLKRLEEELQCRMQSPSHFGEVIRVSTFGESHGPAVGAVLDGIKPGIEISENDIQSELDRRRLRHGDR